MQRRFLLLLLMLFTTNALAATKLSRELARKRISELVSFKLVPDAIEIRRISEDSAGRAIAETTITLAFQFKKTDSGEWDVDAIRFGDRDWVSMSELLAAIDHGKPAATPVLPPRTPTARPVTPIEKLHVDTSDFEKERARMIELGASRLVPGA